jgi:hypothetical protein
MEPKSEPNGDLQVVNASKSLNALGDPKLFQLEPARRLAAPGGPSATSGVIAVGTLRP